MSNVERMDTVMAAKTSIENWACSREIDREIVLKATPDLILVHDCNGLCVAAHVPPGFPVPSAEELIGRNVLSFLPWHCSAEDLALYAWIDETKEPQVIERVLPGKPKHQFFEIRIVPLTGGKLLSIAREVTNRRETEDRLRATLIHKDILLKELHHRVKNNLQVMMSLLGLQTSAIQDPLARAFATESERRVRSMAIVHNYLDASREDGRVNLSRYVGGVVDELFHAFGVNPDHVVLSIEAEPIELRWELATNIGLIVNELVSNALKYAFPNGRSGRLRIVISGAANGALELIVADDGRGLPNDLDIGASSTLGLQLVSTLVEQLHGSVRIESNNGASFTIRFPPGTVLSRITS